MEAAHLAHQDNHAEDDNVNDGSNAESRNIARDEAALRQQRMKLTGEEEDWALGIKEIIEMEPGLEPLNDFWYAQLALDCKTDIEAAVLKAHSRQAFIEECDIVDNANHGLQCVAEFLDVYPGYLIHLCSESGKQSTAVYDVSKCDGFDSLKHYRGMYYILQCMSSELYQIRNGSIILMEWEGYNWTRNFGVSKFLKWWDQLASWYPLVLHKVASFHTGTLAHVVLTIARKLLPEGEREKFEFGYFSSIPRLDGMYSQPSIQAARERILERVQDGLQRRYANEAAFSFSHSGDTS